MQIVFFNNWFNPEAILNLLIYDAHYHNTAQLGLLRQQNSDRNTFLSIFFIIIENSMQLSFWGNYMSAFLDVHI